MTVRSVTSCLGIWAKLPPPAQTAGHGVGPVRAVPRRYAMAPRNPVYPPARPVATFFSRSASMPRSKTGFGRTFWIHDDETRKQRPKEESAVSSVWGGTADRASRMTPGGDPGYVHDDARQRPRENAASSVGRLTVQGGVLLSKTSCAGRHLVRGAIVHCGGPSVCEPE